MAKVLIFAVRSDAGPRPPKSHHVSRPSFDVVKQRILDEIKSADKKKPNMKKQALFRDGFRCVISGVLDLETWRDLPADERKALAAEPANYTQAAHLFSESAQNGDKAST